MTKREEAMDDAGSFAKDVLETLNEAPHINRNLALGALLTAIANLLDNMSENVESVRKLAKDFASRAIVE